MKEACTSLPLQCDDPINLGFDSNIRRSEAICRPRREFTNFNYIDFITTFYGSEIEFYRMLSPLGMTMGFHAIKSIKYKRKNKK